MKFSKLTLCAACVAASAILLCACGDSGSGSSGSTGNESGEQDAGTTAASNGYTFDVSGVTVAMNAEMAPIVDELGEADSYFESESCAFQGLDKVYTYGSVQISTYPENDVDYVYSVVLKDDTVETPEGITIGSSKDDVTAAYGDPTSQTDASLSYTKGDSILAFILDGDTVTDITYTAITD